MEKQDKYIEDLKQEIEDCDFLLIGIGSEWSKRKTPEVAAAYESLYKVINGKKYFIITTVTDGSILETGLDSQRIVAPCGNENWLQCSKSCTKDIWERGELPDDLCPHCSAPLTANTIAAENYIEEGYLPLWERYKKWLTGTLNKNLLVLELGEDFKTPTVIRWPFEKTVYFNQKSHMYRVNETLCQITEEIKDRSVSVNENSVELIKKLVAL